MSEFDDLYRAPRATSVSEAAPIRGAQLKWVYAGLVAAGQGAGFLSSLWEPLVVAAFVLVIGGHLVGIAWLDRAWREVRRGNAAMIVEGKSPRSPLRGLLIPFYNVYWGFAVHSRLNDALEASLRRRNLEGNPEPGWAYGAMSLMIFARLLQGSRSGVAASIALVVADLLWFIYMSRFDDLRRVVALADQQVGETASGETASASNGPFGMPETR